MARDTRKSSFGFIFLPEKVNRLIYKVTRTNTADSTLDITNEVVSFSYTLTETERIGTFDVVLSNSDGKFLLPSNLLTGGDTVKLYIDYADTDAETIVDADDLKFQGKIDMIKHSMSDTGGFIVRISGRQVPEALDATLNTVFEGDNNESAIKAVVSSLNSNYTNDVMTTTNVADTGEVVNASYRNKSYWNIITDLVDRADYGCYIDKDNDLNTYEKSSTDKNNDDEAIVFGQNVLSINGYGDDFNLVKNKIRVYGNQEEGSLILYTSEDSTSQASTWIKEQVVSDSSIINVEQSKEKGDSFLSNLKDTEADGNFLCLGMLNLNPGDKIQAVVREIGLESRVRVKQFTNTVTAGGGFTTNIMIEKVPNTLPKLIKERMTAEEDLRNFANPNDLEQSYHFVFNDESQTASLTNINIADGQLQLDTSSADTGTFESARKLATENITQVEVRMTGNDLELSQTYVSNDNGATFDQVVPALNGKTGELHNMSTSGKQLRLKIVLKSSSTLLFPRVESAVVLYK